MPTRDVDESAWRAALLAVAVVSMASCAGPSSAPAREPAPPPAEIAARAPSTNSAANNTSPPPVTASSAEPLASAPRCGPGGHVGPDGRCDTVPPPPLNRAAPRNREAAEAPVEAAPRVPGGLSRGDGTEADRALLDGDRAYEKDAWPAAKKAYGEAKRLAASDPAPRVGLIRVALAEGSIPVDYAAAPKDPRMRALLRDADAALRVDKNYGPAHIERGRILLVLGKAEEALHSLTRGVELTPDDPEAHSALGVAYMATGKTAQALDELKHAADLDSASSERQTNLGTAYMMRGKVEDALRAYERATELTPDDARAQSDLGTAYLAKNRADKALEHLERAAALAPERATILSNLGYAYQLLGRMDEAIATYRRALAKDEKLGSAWINLGTALAQKSAYDEAERAFRRALAIDPSDPRAKANLSDLAEMRKTRARQKPSE